MAANERKITDELPGIRHPNRKKKNGEAARVERSTRTNWAKLALDSEAIYPQWMMVEVAKRGTGSSAVNVLKKVYGCEAAQRQRGNRHYVAFRRKGGTQAPVAPTVVRKADYNSALVDVVGALVPLFHLLDQIDEARSTAAEAMAKVRDRLQGG